MKANEAKDNVKKFAEDKDKLAEERQRKWNLDKEEYVIRGTKDATEKLKELYEKINKLSKEGKTELRHYIFYSNPDHGRTYLQALFDVLEADLVKNEYKVVHFLESNYESQYTGSAESIINIVFADVLIMTISWEDKNE